jgi:ribonuclease HII
MQTLPRSELSRLKAMSVYEYRLAKSGYSSIAGIDEAGRGPLAGPVVAAACILPRNVYFEHLNDSKQLDARTRESCFAAITSHPETRFGLGICDVKTIDRVNILQATLLAMLQAVAALLIPPDFLLIDGNQVPKFDIPNLAIVGGDGKSVSIAAASVIAKVTRDRMMEGLDKEWPHYGFKKHKGYGTKEHIEAIREFGACPIHRRTFAPIKSLLIKIGEIY